MLLAGIVAVCTEADSAICGPSHGIRFTIVNVRLILFHKIQKRPLSGVFTRHFFRFYAATNSVDGLPKCIFSCGPPHVLELGRGRILHFCSNR